MNRGNMKGGSNLRKKTQTLECVLHSVKIPKLASLRKTYLKSGGVICLAVVLWHLGKIPQTPVVNIRDGAIQGNVRYSRDGHQFWEFVGIPYAVPPTGKRKFKPPTPPQPWGRSVKQVTSYPPNCAQYEVILTANTAGNLDCLYLNVFVNTAPAVKERLKPVLVYLYGGWFISGGTSLYQPEILMDHPVVLVVINYRTGPYGFLNLQRDNSSHGTDKVKGNMGLWDQNLALRWIQKNIGFFGGDRKRVTLIGLSAGAASAQMHLFSPLSRGLFHRAVFQSGSALAPWAFSETPRDVAEYYARRLPCRKDIYSCFDHPDWRQVVQHQHTLLEPLQKKHLFVPSIDGTFLTRRPRDRLRVADFPAIPTMWGVNSGEGGMRTGRFEAMPELVSQLDTRWTELLHNLLLLDHPVHPGVAHLIRQYYFGNLTNFTQDLETFKKNLTLLMSDVEFFLPMHRSAISHAQLGAPTYLYYFNYTSRMFPGTYNVYRAFRLEDWVHAFLKVGVTAVVDWIREHLWGQLGSHKYGIGHAEDIYQLWNVKGLSNWFSRWDADFSRAFSQAVVDFAEGTDPLKFRGTPWPSVNNLLYSSEVDQRYSLPYMVLDQEETPKVISEPFGNRMQFWDSLNI